MSSFPELYFNVDNGYLEGLVRGFKAGVLRQGDYVNLVQCESLEDLKLHLQSTDYGNFLANEASPLTVSVIDDKLKEKMVVEFRHMRNHAYEPLASFLDFITRKLCTPSRDSKWRTLRAQWLQEEGKASGLRHRGKELSGPTTIKGERATQQTFLIYIECDVHGMK